ncbi:hypothetical protein EB118_18230 [bacterium]|nr:hypothetical protein [Pseudomonadota bacterium]NDG31998.1 hypothetical protein [bacterium]
MHREQSAPDGVGGRLGKEGDGLSPVEAVRLLDDLRRVEDPHAGEGREEVQGELPAGRLGVGEVLVQGGEADRHVEARRVRPGALLEPGAEVLEDDPIADDRVLEEVRDGGHDLEAAGVDEVSGGERLFDRHGPLVPQVRPSCTGLSPAR